MDVRGNKSLRAFYKPMLKWLIHTDNFNNVNNVKKLYKLGGYINRGIGFHICK